MPRAVRGLKGWERLMPGETRRPLPWIVVAAIALVLCRFSPPMALCWLTMVDAYLRPSELVEMLVEQVVPSRASAGMRDVALHLNPDYRQRRGKTGELDESVLVSRRWLGNDLERYASGRARGQRLWPFTLTELRASFLKSADEVGISFLNPVLYMARHSGASVDRLQDRFTLAEVQKRGRWRCMSSVRRYEKHALLQEVLARMRPSKVACAEACAAKLEGVVTKLCVSTKTTGA